MKKIIISALVIAIVISLYFILNNSIKMASITQNELNINSVLQCVDSLYTNDDNLYDALDTCAKGVRSGGSTGDMFVIRKSDKKLFWDPSTDCKPENTEKLYMTKDGVCSLFNSPKTCVASVNDMLTKKEGMTSWMFDDSEEHLYFKTFTYDSEDYVIANGAQTDEVSIAFRPVLIGIFISGVLTIFMVNILI